MAATGVPIVVPLVGNIKPLAKTLRDAPSKLGGAVKAMGTMGVTAGAAVVAGAVKGLSDFAELDASVREVASLLGDASEEQISGLRDQIRSVAKDFGTQGTDVAKAFYDGISAGVAPADIEQFVRDASKFAVAGATGINESVDLLTSAQNAFKIDADEANKVADVFFGTVKSGKTTAEELSSAFFQVGPAANSAGLGIEEATGWLAHLTLSGTPTSVAATQIKSAMGELSKPSSKLATVFSEISGKSFPDFIAGGGTLEEAMVMIGDHSETTGRSLFDMAGSVETAQAIMGVTGENAAGFSDTLDGVANSTGAVDTAFGVMSDGAKFKWGKIKAQFTDVFLEIGERLMPVLEPAMDWLADSLPTVFDAVGTAFSWLQTKTEPVIDWIKDNWRNVLERVKDVFVDLWEKAQPAISWLKEKIPEAFEAVMEKVKPVISWVQDNWRPALDGVKDAIVGLWEKAQPAIRWVKDVLIAAFEDLRKNKLGGLTGQLLLLGGGLATLVVVVPKVVKAIKAAKIMFAATKVQAAAMWAAITGPLGLTVIAIAALGTAFLVAYHKVEPFRNVVDTIGRTIRDVVWPVMKGFGAFIGGVLLTQVQALWDIFKNLIGFFTNIFTGDLSGAWDNIKGIFSGAFEYLFALPIKLFEKFGGFIPKLWGWVTDIVTAAPGKLLAVTTAFLKWSGEMLGKVLTGFADLMADIWQWAIDFAKDLPKKFLAGVTAMGTWVGDMALKVLEGYAGLLADIWQWAVDFAKDLPKKFLGGVTAMGTWVADMALKVLDGYRTLATNIWQWAIDFATELPERFLIGLTAIGTWVADIGVKALEGFASLASDVWQWAIDFAADIPDKFLTIVTTVGEWALGLGGTLLEKMGEGISASWRFLKDAIKTALTKAIEFVIPEGSLFGFNPRKKVKEMLGVGAMGGVVTQPTMALIGEAGPEMVVPLSQMPGASPLPSAGIGEGGKVVNNYITVNTMQPSTEVGQAIVDALQEYERHNGGIDVRFAT